LTTIARVPDIGSSTTLRYLDRGIMGVLGPHIATEAGARQPVRACYFGPLGERSFGANRGTDYNAGIADKAAYYREANEQMLVCALLEDAAVLDNLDTILSAPGIGLCSIGPNDFAQSLGYGGQTDHPEVTTRRIQQAGRRMQSDVMQGAWVSDMLLDAGRRILKRNGGSSDGISLTAAISLDAIPLGIDREGSVVVGAIVHTQAGRTVVGASGAERRDMESIDGRACWRSEAEMEV